MRDAARQTIVERYELKKCLMLQARLISEMVKFARNGGKPASTDRAASQADGSRQAAARLN